MLPLTLMRNLTNGYSKRTFRMMIEALLTMQDGGSDAFSLTLFGDIVATRLVKGGPADWRQLILLRMAQCLDPSDNGQQVDANSRRN